MIKKLKNISKNDKIIYKNVLGALLVKGGALIVNLFTLPAYIKYFNQNEVLGVWYTVLSLLNWILTFDLGIGNGLRNHLTEALANGNKEDAKKYISSGYFSIGIIALVATIISPFILKFVDFNSFFNIKPDIVENSSLYISVVIVFIGVMLQFFFKIINSILYALQKSSINNFLVLCTNIITLICVLLLPSFDNNTNVIIMAIVHVVAVLIPLIIATLIVFLTSLKDVLPNIKYVKKTYISKVLSLGMVFFIVQISYMMIMSSNEILITKLASGEYVVEYQTYYKIFSLVGTTFALALTPLWSAITKAKTENNFIWVKSIYKKFIYLAILFSIGSIILIPLIKIIVNIWLGKDNNMQISFFIATIFSILSICLVFNSVFSSIANGLGKLQAQLICFCVGCLLKIPLSCLFVQLMHPIAGVVLANVLSLLPYCIIEPIIINKMFRKLENKKEF